MALRDRAQRREHDRRRGKEHDHRQQRTDADHAGDRGEARAGREGRQIEAALVHLPDA